MRKATDEERRRVCDQCGGIFYITPCSKNRFCSKVCNGIAFRKLPSKECGHCGAVFYATPSKPSNFCSKACRQADSRLRNAIAEEVHPILSAPGYGATKSGAIVTLATGRVKKQYRDAKTGYWKVGLWFDRKDHPGSVHRLVCEAFHGAPPEAKMDAAHGDGDKNNNDADNLRWATRQQNENDKREHGRDNAGERNGHAKLTTADAIAIREAHASAPRSTGDKRVRKGVLKNLAQQYGVSVACIALVVPGRNWRASI